MNPLKKLAGQTAIYGIPTIAARLLNYLLVPLITYQFTNPADFGINAEFYAYISFINIVVLYGMETALFYFSSKENNPESVYSTILISILVTTTIFVAGVLTLLTPLANLVRYPEHTDYIGWVTFIIAFDALAAIPMVRLRQQNKAMKFAFVKTLNIVLNIGLTVFFIGLCKHQFEKNPGSFFGSLYDPSIGIGYVFVANMIANGLTLLALLPEIARATWKFDFLLWKKMIRYASPLIIVGLAGMVNETMDRILLKYLLPESIANEQNGIYAACYKISIIIIIFIQAFRFAAEPFFFSRSAQPDAKKQYADVMNYFVMICTAIFLGTMMNLDWIKYFVHENYHAGLAVVPVLLIAKCFLGIYFNLSIWYKLTGKTQYGAVITLTGAALTLLINIYGIPRYGFMACAWATFAGYGTMMILCWLLGNQHYPVHYDLKRILGYFIISVTLYALSTMIQTGSFPLDLMFKNLLFLLFLLLLYRLEKNKLKTIFTRNENQNRQ